MKAFALAAVLALPLTACIVIPGDGAYVPVEYASLRGGKSLREALDRLEPLLAAYDYRVDGIRVGRIDVPGTHLSYDGPAHSLSTLELHEDCISFTTFVREGSQDYKAPRSVFRHVVTQLARDGDWTVQHGEVCPSSRS